MQTGLMFFPRILAAAYAYVEPYRCVALNSVDKIYEIAISLAQNENIKKANKLRATLMSTLFEKNNCNIVVSNVVLNALKNTPSCSEIYKCSTERCKYSCTRILPFLGVNTDTFRNDFGNLKLAIFMNFPDNEPKCTLCKTSSCITRTFGDHLFIEIPVAKYGH
ncbi:hypothetical protein Bhyg_08211 [Pseudolycoriella hygida]|uniref:Uncharacterized protein n=1 Tax=Pseudolycoriella hygida TaxID=35572 RepID=A0A9Q0N458_9DIPT|nr:hypothetical protein Bhyg_08211 [Pseudolycoriella hygida]